MKSLFSDKATIVIRAMLSQPDRKWVARDFEKDLGVGRARAADAMSMLRKKGFVGGIRSGRLAHSVLLDKKALLDDWVRAYNFELNKAHVYYSSSEHLLARLRDHFKKRDMPDSYALTLHSGANLVTNYVNTRTVYCYLRSEKFNELSLDLRQSLDLKELKRGGNIYLIRPYYKNSAFFGSQRIRGYNVVSDLQLYLDLYNFPQRGRDHALYLLRTLKEEGKCFV